MAHTLLCVCLQPARYTKVEKADILEMTVRYLTGRSRQQPAAGSQTTGLTDVSRSHASPTHYKIGYRACMQDLQQLLASSESLSPDAKDRLIQHLQLTVADEDQQHLQQHKTANGNDAQYLQPGGTINSITINSSINGNRGKLAIKCNSSPPSTPLTVYIPPSQTWSPPVEPSPQGLDHLCSPPSSPESRGAMSPLRSSPNVGLTCTVLQPRNPNTGHYLPSQTPGNVRVYYSGEQCSHATKQEDFPHAGNGEYLNLPECKVVQQFQAMQPFQVCSVGYSPIHDENSNEQQVYYQNTNELLIQYENTNKQQIRQNITNKQTTDDTLLKVEDDSIPYPDHSNVSFRETNSSFYQAPQSVPLNLAAPKPQQVKTEHMEKSESVQRSIRLSKEQASLENLAYHPVHHSRHDGHSISPLDFSAVRANTSYTSTGTVSVFSDGGKGESRTGEDDKSCISMFSAGRAGMPSAGSARISSAGSDSTAGMSSAGGDGIAGGMVPWQSPHPDGLLHEDSPWRPWFN